MNEINIDLNLKLPTTTGVMPVITGYDVATRTVTGTGFGVLPGVAQVFDRLLDKYVPVGVLSWSNTSVKLAAAWDNRDGDTAVKINDSYGYNIRYTQALSGFCRITYRRQNALIAQNILTATEYQNSIENNNDAITKSINSETVYIKAQIIGIEFGSTFNKQTIKFNFLEWCTSFNQPLMLPNVVTTIEYNFLFHCLLFNHAISIPDSVTQIGYNLLAFCVSFNHPLKLPNNITILPENLLYQSTSFNQELIIPSNVTSVGNNVLAYNYAFNKTLTIPSKVTQFGTGLLRQCHAVYRLVVNTTSRPTDTNSLSQELKVNSSMNRIGVHVYGTGRSQWIAGLPNRTTTPWRRLVNGGANLPPA